VSNSMRTASAKYKSDSRPSGDFLSGYFSGAEEKTNADYAIYQCNFLRIF
jgi:hypothetical protein